MDILDNFLDKNAGNEFSEEVTETRAATKIVDSKKINQISHDQLMEGGNIRDVSQQKTSKMKDKDRITSEFSSRENKKLSFYHSDDESSSDDDDVARAFGPISFSENKHIRLEKQSELKRKNEASTEQQVDKPRRLNSFINVSHTVNLNADASSTSSCSCDDHSSVNNGDDQTNDQNLHDDLDYGEEGEEADDDGGKEECDEAKSSSYKNTASKSSERVGAKDLQVDPNEHEMAGHLNHKSISNDLKSKQPTESDKSDSKSCESRRKDDKNTNGSGKSRKGYKSLLKQFCKDACYFSMKSINRENIELSKSMGVWSTSIQNEQKLNKAFSRCRSVILIFSVQQSGKFQGFARMTAFSSTKEPAVPWILPERLSMKSLGGVIKLDWLCTKELLFSDTVHLRNPYNEDKPVKIARDGQLVEPKIGKKLCRLFPHDSATKLISSYKTLQVQVADRKQQPMSPPPEVLHRFQRHNYARAEPHHYLDSRYPAHTSRSQRDFYTGCDLPPHPDCFFDHHRPEHLPASYRMNMFPNPNIYHHYSPRVAMRPHQNLTTYTPQHQYRRSASDRSFRVRQRRHHNRSNG